MSPITYCEFSNFFVFLMYFIVLLYDKVKFVGKVWCVQRILECVDEESIFGGEESNIIILYS